MPKALPLALIALALLSCSRAPDDLREWRPSDHDHTEESSSGQVPANSPSSGGMFGISEVVLAAWKTNCTTCHGIIGRADGPQAAMTKPRDLTDPTWQGSVSDADIASAIQNGRGSMPAFDLPATTVEGLVKLVRLLNRARTLGDGGAADSDAATEAAAPRSADDGGSRQRDAGR